MKNLDDVFELVEDVLPAATQKTIVFCEIEQKSYEIFYYSYFADGSCKQCYEIESEGNIDSTTLKKGFEKIALFLRNCKEYEEDKRNVITVYVDALSRKVEIRYFEKSIGLYKIKKEWKTENLVQNTEI